LRDGVIVDGNITVLAIANEPQMQNAPSWLDPKVKDDRILASVLEVQSNHINSEVILVTGDINLLNKADAMGIQHGELPES
jgi:predicted ribonuclease YlaK